MKTRTLIFPLSLLAIIALAMIAGGSIPQLAGYHGFADQRMLLGVPNAENVLSNLGFLLVGVYGLFGLSRMEGPARFSYGLFFVSLAATAFGSGWYHLAPDNARLLADRLPIALGCAALLAAVAREHLDAPRCINGLLVASAIASVAWWGVTGDLRPYLFLQLAPMVAVPIVQHRLHAPRAERIAYGLAIGFYVAAKLCEIADHSLYALVAVSGHTLKHVLAAIGAFWIAHYAIRKSITV